MRERESKKKRMRDWRCQKQLEEEQAKKQA
jgi:hypothetical protein